MSRSLVVTAASAFAAGMFLTSIGSAQTSSSPFFGQNPTDCWGVNACKGQSACKSTRNACKGQNSCKGKGWVQGLTSLECTVQGGRTGG